MKLARIHWTLHPVKSEGLYHDQSGKPRSPWYDAEIEAKRMSESAIARELDLGYELSVEGIVFKEFQECHILRGAYGVNPGLPVIRYFDYGRVNASVFSQKDGMGRITFFHEIVLEKSGTHEQAKVAQAYSADLPGEAEFRDYDDPAGGNPDHRSETTDTEIMMSHGFAPTHPVSGARRDRRKARIELAKMKLSERIDGQETIRVHESCTTIIDAFLFGYRYVEDHSGKIRDEIHEQHPHEDVMDCVCGTILEEFSPWREPPVKIRRREPIHRDRYTGYGH